MVTYATTHIPYFFLLEVEKHPVKKSTLSFTFCHQHILSCVRGQAGQSNISDKRHILHNLPHFHHKVETNLPKWQKSHCNWMCDANWKAKPVWDIHLNVPLRSVIHCDSSGTTTWWGVWFSLFEADYQPANSLTIISNMKEENNINTCRKVPSKRCMIKVVTDSMWAEYLIH